jgi:hypothetical protein
MGVGRRVKYTEETCIQDELLAHIMDAIAHRKERQVALRRATCHDLRRVAKYNDIDDRILKNVYTLSLEQ